MAEYLALNSLPCIGFMKNAPSLYKKIVHEDFPTFFLFFPLSYGVKINIFGERYI